MKTTAPQRVDEAATAKSFECSRHRLEGSSTSAVVPGWIVLVTISAIKLRFVGYVSRETGSTPETAHCISGIDSDLVDYAASDWTTTVRLRCTSALILFTHPIAASDKRLLLPNDQTVRGKPPERACFTWNSGRTCADAALQQARSRTCTRSSRANDGYSVTWGTPGTINRGATPTVARRSSECFTWNLGMSWPDCKCNSPEPVACTSARSSDTECDIKGA